MQILLSVAAEGEGVVFMRPKLSSLRGASLPHHLALKPSLVLGITQEHTDNSLLAARALSGLASATCQTERV